MKVNKWWITFSQERLRRIKKARNILAREIKECQHDNRDTKMLEEAIEIIDTVISFNKGSLSNERAK